MQTCHVESTCTDLVGEGYAPHAVNSERAGGCAEDRFDVEILVQREMLMLRNESHDSI